MRRRGMSNTWAPKGSRAKDASAVDRRAKAAGGTHIGNYLEKCQRLGTFQKRPASRIYERI